MIIRHYLDIILSLYKLYIQGQIDLKIYSVKEYKGIQKLNSQSANW